MKTASNPRTHCIAELVFDDFKSTEIEVPIMNMPKVIRTTRNGRPCAFILGTVKGAPVYFQNDIYLNDAIVTLRFR